METQPANAQNDRNSLTGAQMINHKVISWVLALVIGIVLSLFAFERISDPEPAMRRAQEETVVMAAREILQSYVSPGQELQLVDPLEPNRKIGKVYVYPTDNGWELSGHYRRNMADAWHPYLMSLDQQGELTSLAVQDANERLVGLSTRDSRCSAVP